MKNNGETRDAGVLSNPLSFLRSGDFAWDYAGAYNHGSGGYYWLSRSRSTAYSNNLYFSNTYLDPQYYDGHGGGFAVRCVQILHHSH